MENPDKVSLHLMPENPTCNSNLSKIPLLDSLDLLAKSGVPLISVCAALDPGWHDNTRVIESDIRSPRRADHGPFIKEGVANYPLAPRDPEQVVNLISTKFTKRRNNLTVKFPTLHQLC